MKKSCYSQEISNDKRENKVTETNDVNFLKEIILSIEELKLNVAFHSDELNETVISSNSHNHNGYEVHCITSESCTFFVELKNSEKNVTLNAGDICIIPPKMYHNTIAKSEHVKSCCFQFKILAKRGKVADAFSGLLPTAGEIFVLRKKEYLIDYVTHAFREMREDRVVIEEKCRAYFTLFFTSLIDEYNVSDGFLKKENRSEASDSVRRRYQIEMFFDRYADSGLRLDDLAAELALSNKQTNRVLKSEYGKTFRELLTQERMYNAKKLLRDTELPLEKIAELVGFETTSGLIHAFQRIFNISPTAYRNNFKDRT